VANNLVDWLWGSGKWGIIRPQRLLGVKADGIVGPKTLAALNAQDPVVFFNKIKEDRKRYIEEIIASSVKAYEKKIGRKSTYQERIKYTNERFRNGWLRRINNIGYGWLKYSNNQVHSF
jgi:lysozyme family protein